MTAWLPRWATSDADYFCGCIMVAVFAALNMYFPLRAWYSRRRKLRNEMRAFGASRAKRDQKSSTATTRGLYRTKTSGMILSGAAPRVSPEQEAVQPMKYRSMNESAERYVVEELSSAPTQSDVMTMG